MSREILFQGKRLDNGEWVNGYYVNLWDSTKERESHRIYIGATETGDTDGSEFYPNYYEVDPETVGKCTGRTDKKGRIMFEGDILRAGNVRGTIIWSEKKAAFAFEWKNYDPHRNDFFKTCLLTEFGSFNELEVIGNIHDL